MQVTVERLRSVDGRMVSWDRFARIVGEGQMIWAERDDVILLWWFWRGVRHVLEVCSGRGELLGRGRLRVGLARVRYWQAKIEFLFREVRGEIDVTGWMVGHEVVRSVKCLRRSWLIVESELREALAGPGAEEDVGLGESSSVGEKSDVDLDGGSD